MKCLLFQPSTCLTTLPKVFLFSTSDSKMYILTIHLQYSHAILDDTHFAPPVLSNSSTLKGYHSSVPYKAKTMQKIFSFRRHRTSISTLAQGKTDPASKQSIRQTNSTDPTNDSVVRTTCGWYYTH
jgi:hypothetical protein